MSASDALTKLRSLGIRAELRADGSVALIPASLVSPELLAEAKAHRDELAAVLANESATAADTADVNSQGATVADAADAADANSQGATVADAAEAADANSLYCASAHSSCSRPAAERKPPTRPIAREWPQGVNEPGLSSYTIHELAHWYEEEGNRRRVGPGLDQNLLDRDLRRILAERGVFPEFIEIEFERVMQVVFAVPSQARAPPLSGISPSAVDPRGASGASRAASVPFMLPQDMKRRLRGYDYSDEEIAHLTPQQAHEILAQAEGRQPNA